MAMSFISEISPDGGTTSYDVKDKNAHLYLECSTARNVADKVVACTGFNLITGMGVSIRFTDTGSSNPSSGNLTLNVNNTGAKSIVIAKSNLTVMTYEDGNEFCNNRFCSFIYDGTYWVFNKQTGSSSGTDLSGNDDDDILLVNTAEM